jgi:hypothetical protein
MVPLTETTLPSRPDSHALFYPARQKLAKHNCLRRNIASSLFIASTSPAGGGRTGNPRKPAVLPVLSGVHPFHPDTEKD